jgi:hypothetical protein
MPTYKQGDVVKVVPPKEFTDQVAAAEAEARVNKMKFNLSIY